MSVIRWLLFRPRHTAHPLVWTPGTRQHRSGPVAGWPSGLTPEASFTSLTAASFDNRESKPCTASKQLTGPMAACYQKLPLGLAPPLPAWGRFSCGFRQLLKYLYSPWLTVYSRGGHDIWFKVKIKIFKKPMKPHGAFFDPRASRKHAGLWQQLAGPSSRKACPGSTGNAKPKAGDPQAGSRAVTRAHISLHAFPLCLNFFNVDADLFLSNYQPFDDINKELPKAISGGSAHTSLNARRESCGRSHL